MIKEDEHEINIFFNNKTFNLIGWQTKDIYQNLNITFLSSIKKNEIFNKDIFKLPIQN
jgi:outer membrane lipoprotein-sorting protein